MQISVSSYSFAQLNKDPLELIRLAKELGFAAIEYIDLPNQETARQLRAESEAQDLPIICYAVAADFLKKDLPAEIARLQKEVDVAEILGCKMIRHDATTGFRCTEATYHSFDQALPILAEGCRAVTEYAAQKGIATMVENHGFYCQDSERLARLVGTVHHPNFGALVDIGNFCCADEDPAKATGNLAAMAKHVHAKDFHIKPGAQDNPGEGWFQSRGGNYLRGAIVGHGNVPVRQCIENIRRAGWDGYVSLEFEGLEDCLLALRAGLRFLKLTMNNEQ